MVTDNAAPEVTPEDAVYDLDADLTGNVVLALAEGRDGRVRELVQPLHYADVADLLERLSPDQRTALHDIIGDDFEAGILSELDDTVRGEIIENMDPDDLAAAVADLDSDDAFSIVEDLEAEEQQQVLDAIPGADRALIEEGLAYPDDSAGRLMQRELVNVPTHWTVGRTIDFMRGDSDGLPDVFYDIFVIDPRHRPVGSIPLSRLLRTKRPILVADIMDTEMKLIQVATDQEDVAFLFRQRDLVSAPVVDDGGRLVGAITVDDVVDVIVEEHKEDIMYLGGVPVDDLYSAAVDTTRSRFSWLLVNLATAILASATIGLFKASIEQMVALAVLMPIVASMGGNAGTQTMTVAVRALATKELTSTNALRVIGKELIVGGINGIVFAVITGAIAWAWFSNPTLALVIAMAMVVNMVVAGLAGTTIPIILDRAGKDPAIASGVCLTTLTDVIGFFTFLGLAAWLLL
jgi:magnesium transporter